MLQTYIANAFFGRAGLRAGWRVLLFILLFIIVALGVGGVWRAVMPHAPMHTGGQMWPQGPAIGESAVVLTLVIVLSVLALLDGTSTRTYGLPPLGIFSRRFAEGALWGFGGLTLILALMRLLHGYYFGVVTGSTAFETRFAFEWAGVFLLVGFAEEVMLRSYLLFSLARGIGFWPAAVLTSLLFALAHVHNPGETPLGIGAVFAVGMLFCLFVQRTGDLWFPIGFHFAWDWAESYFYGVPDSGTISAGTLFHPSFPRAATWLSGGTAGPEGSALCYLILLVMAVGIHMRYPRVAYRYDVPLGGPINPKALAASERVSTTDESSVS